MNFQAQAEAFAAALVGPTWKGRRCRRGDEVRGNCPVPYHSDERGSFGYNVLMDAYACSCTKGKGSELRERLGFTGGNGHNTKASTLGSIVAEYDYKDEKGRLLYQCVRYEPKDFRQRQPNDNGGWIWKLTGVRLVLYRLPELLASTGLVLIPEGEKDVDTARSLGLTATCNPMGAGKWRDEYSDYLKGRDCVIIPDKDAPGEQHAAQVATSLKAAGAKVRVLRLPGAGKDLSDWMLAGGTTVQLQELISQADAWSDYAQVPRDVMRELAALDPMEYEKRRKEEAKKLGVRAAALDRRIREERKTDDDGKGGKGLDLPTPEPWPEPVGGAELLDEVVEVFRRYTVLPDGAAEALALWVLHAHAQEAAQVSPRLAICSPEKRCGKTVTLTLLGGLTPRPLPTANITPAALFRTIEAACPTLLIDEADTFFHGNNELRGILNSGHGRANAFVVRTVGDDFEPRRFRTWAPVAIACIGRLPDTLEDRSIMLPMRRKRKDEAVTKLRVDRLDDLKELARRAARWALDNVNELKTADPAVPDGLHDRAADNWRPLLAIADAASGSWPDTARRVCLKLSRSTDRPSVNVQLLEDIRHLFHILRADRISSNDLCSHLAAIEDRPWGELKRGKAITPNQLARRLKAFDVEPKGIRVGDKTPKGYELASFQDAFDRYLPSQTATPQHEGSNASLETVPATFDNCNGDPVVAVPDSGAGPDKSDPNADCGVVADQSPGNGHRDPVACSEGEYEALEREAIQSEGAP